MCCIVCVFKGVTSTCTEEAKYGTCLTPLGQFQKPAGFSGAGYLGASREHAGPLQGAGAGNQQRVWMLATEMGKKGGKFESKCEMCTSPALSGPRAHKSKLFGCCPLRWHFVERCPGGARLFCNARERIKHFERLELGCSYSALSCALVRSLLTWW